MVCAPTPDASLHLPIDSLGKDEDASGGDGESEGGTISITQILSLKERFDRADTDGGGSLDLQEFMDGMVGGSGWW